MKCSSILASSFFLYIKNFLVHLGVTLLHQLCETESKENNCYNLLKMGYFDSVCAETTISFFLSVPIFDFFAPFCFFSRKISFFLFELVRCNSACLYHPSLWWHCHTYPLPRTTLWDDWALTFSMCIVPNQMVNRSVVCSIKFSKIGVSQCEHKIVIVKFSGYSWQNVLNSIVYNSVE